MNHRLSATLAALTLAFASTAHADTASYSFSGLYNFSYSPGTSSTLTYTGTFDIVDPVVTSSSTSPGNSTYSPTVWQGTSDTYSGAQNLHITFDNGTTVSSDVLTLVVNNTSFQGIGSPFPLGQSAQIYTGDWMATPMTSTFVCAAGVSAVDCGDSVDPLHVKGDDAEKGILHTTGMYFAFYNKPGSGSGVPDLSTFGGAGLGVYATNSAGLSTTTLTSMGITQTAFTPTAPVPEPKSLALLLAGLMAVVFKARRQAR